MRTDTTTKTPTQKTTEADRYRSVVMVENFLREAVVVTLTITSKKDTENQFSKRFELAQGNTMHAQQTYTDLEILSNDATVSVETENGMTETYGWNATKSDDERELWIEIKEDGVHFRKE